MALINLKHIGEVASEAHLNMAMIEAFLLGHDRKPAKYKGVDIIFIFKLNKQANTLLNGLRRLHKTCTDFATGNFQSYIDEYDTYKESDEDIFDPFQELDYLFDTQSITDLPPKIEQYAELCRFMPSYAKLQQAKREGFAEFFGKIPKSYSFTNPEGETVFVPESELPEDVVTKIEANQMIEEYNVEYCLDDYNTFYERCMGLIATHKPIGDAITCAQEILKLFAPYTHRGKAGN